MDTSYVGQKAQPWELRAKPAWQRLVVLAGGVAMNMVLAAAIFIGITGIFGESRTAITAPAYIEANSVFASMGMKSGDRLVAINGQKLQYWEEALDPEHFASKKLQFTIERNGETLTLQAPKDILSRLNDNQAIGIRPTMPPIQPSVGLTMSIA